MVNAFDINFENVLIKEDVEEIYEDIIAHADRRQLETHYVVKKYIEELQKLARRDGYIK